jgi:peptide-methionine (S)-S-oxide reductase
MLFTKKPVGLPTSETALKGRPNAIATAETHFVLHRKMLAPPPSGFETVVFALGCFWGAERVFWKQPGVWLSRVGYAGGLTPNPTYEEVCSGRTGHTEVVEVQFDPGVVSLAALMKTFLESHDPTQGMRQGNDVGSQYRSAVYFTSDAQGEVVRAMLADYQSALTAAGRTAPITTEVAPLDRLYLAEDYHQQYLAKNPAGYCGIGGTGVICPLPSGHPGLAVS